MASAQTLGFDSASAQDALRLCAERGDEERYVGLMMVARVLPFHAQPDAFLRRALDACGLVFVERMLRTPLADADADADASRLSAGALRPLALKLLAWRMQMGPLDTPRGHELASLALAAYEAGPAADAAGADAAPDALAAVDGLHAACALASDGTHVLALLRDGALLTPLAQLLALPLSQRRAEGACDFVDALVCGLDCALDCAAEGGDGPARLAARGMDEVAEWLTRAAHASAEGSELRLRLLGALCAWLRARAHAARAPRAHAERSGWLDTLRGVLHAHLSGRLPPRARADGLELASSCLDLFGGEWAIAPPTAAARARGAHGAPAAAAAPAAGAAQPPGAFVNLLVQLAAVELAMGLRTDDADPTAAEAADARECVRALLACASLVEFALVELHADVDDEEEGDERMADGAAASGARTRCWATRLDDESLLSIQRALLGVVETAAQFSEDVSALGGEHALKAVAARLLAAWLAQPSAVHSGELHARVERTIDPTLLPSLRAEERGGVHV